MPIKKIVFKMNIYSIIFIIIFIFISCDTEQKQKVYTVTFNANGASGTPPAAITVEDENYYDHWNRIKLPDKGNLNYEGKQFYGWNTSPNGTGKYYSAGSYLQVFSNIALYAQWEQFLAPGNLRITSLNTLEWDAPEGYEDLSGYGSDGDTRIGYLLFRRPVESTGNFSFYGYYQDRSVSFSVHDYNWGIFEFFVALGVITFSYYEGLADGIFIINYENNYTIKLGPHSNVVTARIFSTSEVLPAPVGLRAVAAQNGATLYWDSVWPTDYYRVYESRDGYNWHIYKETNRGTTASVWHDVPGSTFYYRIAAINPYTWTIGIPSDAITITSPGRPNIITGLSATAESSTSIVISWNESSKATAYEVYYKNGNNNTRYLADTVIGTTYIHTGLIPNTNYTYEIDAINNELNLIYSSSYDSGGWGAPFVYYTLPSVSCSTPAISASVEPVILTISNNTSNHIRNLHINDENILSPKSLNKNTSLQISLSSGTYKLLISDAEGQYMSIPITLGNESIRYSITDNDWLYYTDNFIVTLKNNYSYAIAGIFLRKEKTIYWDTNLLGVGNSILTNTSRSLGSFNQGSYEIYAESSEYYRVSSGTNDRGITISGGILDGYRHVYYLFSPLVLLEDTTLITPAAGWQRILP